MRRQRLMSWTVAAVIVLIVGVIANIVFRPEEGPSQARAWDVCEDYAKNNLDLADGARFAEFPANPSDRVKLQLGSNRYDVYSFYQLPDVDRQDFRCTVAYLGGDEWQVLNLVTRSD